MTDNELIAEFMGVVETEGFYDSYGTPTAHYYTAFMNYRTRSYTGKGESWGEFLQEAKYNESWDWLMPVVEKIHDTAPTDVIEINIEGLAIFELGIATPIAEVYKAVVEFIKWYNANK